jgi:hypothetical protein
VIEQGEVKLIDESAHERPRVVQIVYAGSSVGDLPVLLETACLYTAVTRRETTTLGFSRERFSALLEANPFVTFASRSALQRIRTARQPSISPSGSWPQHSGSAVKRCLANSESSNFSVSCSSPNHRLIWPRISPLGFFFV